MGHQVGVWRLKQMVFMDVGLRFFCSTKSYEFEKKRFEKETDLDKDCKQVRLLGGWFMYKVAMLYGKPEKEIRSYANTKRVSEWQTNSMKSA